MFKKILIPLAIIVLAATAGSTVYSYQSHYGPTELTYYDREKAFNGYTLFSPFQARNTFLIDMEGRLVHSWERGGVEKYAYFLENGNIIWGLSSGRGQPASYQELDWDGNVIWELKDTREGYTAHHDFQKIWNKKLKAYTTVTFDNAFVVRNIKVIQGSSGLFIAMPSRKKATFSHSRTRNSGSASRSSRAAIPLAITAGGRPVVKMKGRARLIKNVLNV